MIIGTIRRTLLLVTVLAVPILAQEPAVRYDPFAPLRFFVGAWRGAQNGEPGHGTADRTYSFVLNGRFLQVNNTRRTGARTGTLDSENLMAVTNR